jgi:predicted HAD superfamily phosphohydrolase
MSASETGKHKADPRADRKAAEVPVDSADGPDESTATTPAEIEAEIEQQREELAETLDALTAKLDVKSQAQAKAQEVKATTQVKVTETKDFATTDAGKPRPELVAGVAVVVVGVVALVWWRRRR